MHTTHTYITHTHTHKNPFQYSSYLWNGLIGNGCRLVNSMIITANLKSHIKFLFFPFEVHTAWVHIITGYHKQSVRSSFVIVYSQWIYVFILSRDPTQILLPRKRLNRNNHTYDIEYVSNVCSNLVEAWNQRTQKYTLGTEQITKHPKIHIDTKNKQNKCQRKLTGGAMEK